MGFSELESLFDIYISPASRKEEVANIRTKFPDKIPVSC